MPALCSFYHTRVGPRRTLWAQPPRAHRHSPCVQRKIALKAAIASSSDTEQAQDVEDVGRRLKDRGLIFTSSLINGEWQPTQEGETYQLINPATGRPIATVRKDGEQGTKDAIKSAHDAFEGWSRGTTAAERAQFMRRWYHEIDQNKEDIAQIMTAECGKPLAEARKEISEGLSSVEWFAAEAERVRGQVLQSTQPGRTMLTLKQPVGVVAAITPWNFPFAMITRKVSPALACGCTVVLKPADSTPLTAFTLAHLATKAGLPAGVLNVVTGESKTIGTTLMESNLVRKVTFTGSTKVGKVLSAQAADTVKRVSMELGGHAPFIVFPDADLKEAAKAAVASRLMNAGQTCICTNRTLVHADVYDEFVQLATEEMKGVKQGDGAQEGITMGPCIKPERLELAQAHVDDAVEHGAEIKIGGGRPKDLTEGYFFEPTLISNATKDLRIFREETFGPVLPVFKFTSDEEAIEMANETEYGLAAYFFSKDMGRVWKVAKELDYGLIGVNAQEIISATAPFGGMKQSGIGREDGPSGMDPYLEEKYVCMQY